MEVITLLAYTLSNGTNFAWFIVGCFQLPQIEMLLITGQLGGALFIDKLSYTQVLVVRLQCLNFQESAVPLFLGEWCVHWSGTW